jgi:hypothetical protein
LIFYWSQIYSASFWLINLITIDFFFRIWLKKKKLRKYSIPIFFSLLMKVTFSLNFSYFSKWSSHRTNFFFNNWEVFNIEGYGQPDHYQLSRPYPICRTPIPVAHWTELINLPNEKRKSCITMCWCKKYLLLFFCGSIKPI